MSKTYLTEAFKSMEVLNEDTFTIDNDGIAKLDAFADADEIDDTVQIIDPEANTEEELQDSYVGKVILDCNVCHTKQYKAPEEVIVNEETQIACEDMECPYCYSVDGYKIVGQVAEYCKDCATDEEVPAEDDISDDNGTITEAKTGNLALRKLFTGDPKYFDKAEKIITRWYSYENDYDINNPDKDVISGMAFEADKDESDIVYKAMPNLLTEAKTGNLAAQDKNLNNSQSLNRKPVDESLDKVTIETDDQTIEVKAEDKAEGTEETIVPVTDDVKTTIQNNSTEYDIDDFEDADFDELGESYLKNVYNNVESYKTTAVKSNGKTLKVEGKIKFTSGKEKATDFMFEARDTVKPGVVRFIGENCQISKGKKSFILTGKVNNKAFLAESLNYNYRAKDENGKTTRVYGTVKKSAK